MGYTCNVAARELARGVVKRALRTRGLDVRRLPVALAERPEAQLTVTLDHIIASRLLEGPQLFFVQIGAFDGRTDDQLHDYVMRYGWRGILVEPQPRPFEELQRTYANCPGLDLRNVAISERNEVRRLYAIRDMPDLPASAPQSATFDRTKLEEAGFAEAQIEVHEVECVPLSDLLAHVEGVDLLQIDVEGYDAEVIRMFEFERYQPSIVRFENFHISDRDHNEAIARLIDHGYKVAITGIDTVGWYDG